MLNRHIRFNKLCKLQRYRSNAIKRFLPKGFPLDEKPPSTIFKIISAVTNNIICGLQVKEVS